jgi:GNAT superfamily N-acetyltransferase
MPHHSARRDHYLISTDPALLDPVAAHAYLTRSYWSPGIPLETVRRGIENSLAFGVYDDSAAPARPRQIGLARVITDKTTFAYLCDVYILEPYRGRGLSKWLIETVLTHPDLQGLRRFCLLTRDAHTLYERFGFTPMPDASRYLERLNPKVYRPI